MSHYIPKVKINLDNYPDSIFYKLKFFQSIKDRINKVIGLLNESIEMLEKKS
jgi:hypothetical protein